MIFLQEKEKQTRDLARDYIVRLDFRSLTLFRHIFSKDFHNIKKIMMLTYVNMLTLVTNDLLYAIAVTLYYLCNNYLNYTYLKNRMTIFVPQMNYHSIF